MPIDNTKARIPTLCPICGANLIPKKRGKVTSIGGSVEIFNVGVSSSEEIYSLECNDDKNHKFYVYLAPKDHIYETIQRTWKRKYEYPETVRIDYASTNTQEERTYLDKAIADFPQSLDDASYAWIYYPQKTLSRKLNHFKGFWILLENYIIDGFNISFKFAYGGDSDWRRKKYILLEVYLI